MILYLILCVFLVFYLYLRHVYGHWKRLGFPYLRPEFPFGVLGPVARQKQSLGELIRDIHLERHEPYLGLFLMTQPALLIRDPVLVKRILVTDFACFADRGVHYDEQSDPVGANLFGMPVKQWKELRTKISPIFSTGSLRNMFGTVQAKTQQLKEFLDKWVETEQEVRLRNLLIKLNVSVVASVFFGFELNAFRDPHHEFNKIGEWFFDTNKLRNKMSMVAFFVCPSLFQWLKIPFMPPMVSQCVLNLVSGVMEARKEDPSLIRQDFIQTVMEFMQEKGKDGRHKMDVTKCAAQAFLFYTASYETSAAVISYCLYELSQCPEWMQKVRLEVDELMAKSKNSGIDYESVQKFPILDACIRETLRKFPALPLLNRQCTREYTIPGSTQVIPKGTKIIIPTYGLHTDPKYYPDPLTFNPSRFQDVTWKTNEAPFYPFGGGPRFCIAARLGWMIIRMGLCTLIHNYSFTPLTEELKFLPGSLILSDINHIHMGIEIRGKPADTSE